MVVPQPIRVEKTDLIFMFQSEPGCQGAGVVNPGGHPGASQLVLLSHLEDEVLEVPHTLLGGHPVEVPLTQVLRWSALPVVTVLLVYKIFQEQKVEILYFTKHEYKTSEMLSILVDQMLRACNFCRDLAPPDTLEQRSPVRVRL